MVDQITTQKVTEAVKSVLERVVSGGNTSTEELRALLTWDSHFTAPVATAWHQLSHWIADSDIRAREPDYEEQQRADLATLLPQLDTD